MTKYAGRGLTLSIEGSVIGQVMSGLDGIGSSRDLFDQSAYGDDWKDWGVGQQDGSEVNVVIAYDPIDTEHLALIAAYEAGTPTNFSVDHDEAAWAGYFTAMVTSLTRGGEIGGVFQMAATLKIVEPGVAEGS